MTDTFSTVHSPFEVSEVSTFKAEVFSVKMKIQSWPDNHLDAINASIESQW